MFIVNNSSRNNKYNDGIKNVQNITICLKKTCYEKT